MWLERNPAMQNMEKLALLGGTPVRSRLLPYAHQTIDSGDIAAVGEALSSSFITQGPTLERFERALAGRARVKHAVAFSSGTAALHGACWAAGIGPGDRAITTPLTFAATANAVVYQGARPVFADIDTATLDLDPDAVKRAGRGVCAPFYPWISPACPATTTACCRSRARKAGPSSPMRRIPSAAPTGAGRWARSPT